MLEKYAFSFLESDLEYILSVETKFFSLAFGFYNMKNNTFTVQAIEALSGASKLATEKESEN